MTSKRELFVEAKGKWLKECPICNAGLCATIDDLLAKTSYSLNSVCEIMAQESDGLYDGAQIKSRYLYHHNKAGRNSTREHQNDIDDVKRQINGEIALLTPEERVIEAQVLEGCVCRRMRGLQRKLGLQNPASRSTRRN